MIRLERLLEVFALGLRSLYRNKLRSFLTMLGMIFGVGSVMAMLSVGAGARREILESIQSAGIRNIIVNSVRPPEETKPSNDDDRMWVERYGITFDDRALLEATCASVEKVLPVNLVKQPVWRGSRRCDASVLGVLPEHLRMFHLDVGQGRPFNEVDEATERKVCIVRRGLIEQLQILSDPLGATLRIGSEPFEIVGILDSEHFRSYASKVLAIDDRAQQVYIPYATSMRAFGTFTYVERNGNTESTNVELDQMIVVAGSAELVRPTSRIVDAALKHGHKKKDYEIIVPLDRLEELERTQSVFNQVMILIAAISLIVGGIGIANIMLATITERTKEIGVRRALGARRRDIVAQFLTETATIGIVGGVFGCVFGRAAIEGIVKMTSWKAEIAWSFVGISLAISAFVAVLAGIYPARRAALMDPITALRHE